SLTTSLIPQPPRPNPFPYTTLFRSVPNLPDADPHARPNGMAIRFTLPDQTSTDIVSISYNGFPVATPEEFLELLTAIKTNATDRSEEHTSELQSRENLVCRLLLEKK